MTIQGADLVAVFSGGFLEAVTQPSAPSVSGTATELDTELLEDVYDLIDELGKTVTFWLYPDEDYDATIGKTTTGDATEYDLKVWPPYEVKLREVDGDVAKIGDCVIGLPAKDLEFTPDVGVKVTIDGNIWVIVKVAPIYSGEQICVYALQLRK